MTRERIFVLFHGRFPSEKAAALFAAENAKSLASWRDVFILVPSRRGTDPDAAIAVYGLPSNVHVVRLPSLDLFGRPALSSLAFLASLMSFTVSAWRYLHASAHATDIVFSNDLLCALAATGTSARVVYEVHDYPERWHGLFKTLFSRADLIIATNEWKRDALQRKFPAAAEKIIMERNGVDLAVFGTSPSKAESRARLGLPEDARLVLYTGHLYGWKGTDTFAAAARLLPALQFVFVGGTENDVRRMRDAHKEQPNVRFVGHVPHADIPLWQAAADVLVLPNTAKEEISARYTSPMKLFEYMASGRPIVATRLPSVLELVDNASAFLCAPDNPEDLARALEEAFGDPHAAEARARAARSRVESFSWERRAERLKKLVAP